MKKNNTETIIVKTPKDVNKEFKTGASYNLLNYIKNNIGMTSKYYKMINDYGIEYKNFINKFEANFLTEEKKMGLEIDKEFFIEENEIKWKKDVVENNSELGISETSKSLDNQIHRRVEEFKSELEKFKKDRKVNIDTIIGIMKIVEGMSSKDSKNAQKKVNSLMMEEVKYLKVLFKNYVKQRNDEYWKLKRQILESYENLVLISNERKFWVQDMKTIKEERKLLKAHKDTINQNMKKFVTDEIAAETERYYLDDNLKEQYKDLYRYIVIRRLAIRTTTKEKFTEEIKSLTGGTGLSNGGLKIQ